MLGLFFVGRSTVHVGQVDVNLANCKAERCNYLAIGSSGCMHRRRLALLYRLMSAAGGVCSRDEPRLAQQLFCCRRFVVQVCGIGLAVCRFIPAHDSLSLALGDDPTNQSSILLLSPLQVPKDSTPKSTPPSSPAKTAKLVSPEKEVLRPISMPKPFQI